MNTRNKIIVGVSATVAALLIALGAVWWFVLRSDAPPPVSLDEAVGAVASTTASASGTGLDGDWSAVPGNGSFAGYRVDEQLVTVGFTTAAGRSEDLEAGLTISDHTVVGVDVTVNMQALRSDSNRRDGALRQQALQTDSFPTGSFSLVDPIVLPDSVESGVPFTTVAAGDLTLHGVTNRVDLELSAQLVDGVIAVVGSIPVVFADYDIDPPSAMAVLSVADNGVMEFQLLFERS
jgi:polyisoprenoid-binding protein YceI